MTVLESWEQRPTEEAYLFNPAFCGALSYEFVKSFRAASTNSGMELPLIFCALPISLHMETRRKLPSSTVTSLYTWLQRQPESLVGFAQRARDLAPYVKQGLSFGVANNTLAFDENGLITLGERKATFTPKVLESATAEVREIVHTTRMIGRWFAGAGTTATILASWGVTV